MDIEKLYQDYFLVVYKYILSISHDSLTAEEITQDTFFKALKKIDDFRGDSGIRVWLCQIAKNTYYDYVKRQGRLSELPEEYGEPTPSVEDSFLLSADAKEIHWILHDLREPYKEVFSPDSRALVEEHLETCEGCTDYYHALKEPEGNDKQMKKTDEKAAFKRIKGTLQKKRLITILVTAVCIAALGFGLFYGLVVHEKYIPYEESGLYVSEEAIRTDRDYYKSTGLYSPDGETLFLYMTTTAYTQMRNDTSMADVPIISLDRAARTSTIEDDNGTVTQQVCKEVYYVPEKTAKQYMRAMKWTNEGVTDEEIQKNREQEVEALKNASVLLWRESEE